MAVKKGDFIEIEYTGRLKEEKLVFDTTREQAAKDNSIYNQNASYEPVIICLGEGQIVPGLDEELQGKEPGMHKIELPPEKAFGKKNAKLIQMVPLKKFTDHQIRPFPGLQINIDNRMGTIKTVSGGRVLVDFNHPLSGKEITYEIEIKRIVTDKKEQIDSLLKLILGIQDAKIEINANKAKVLMKVQLPPPIEDELKKKIKELTSIEEMEFAKEESKKEKTLQKAKAAEDSHTNAPKSKQEPAETPNQEPSSPSQ